ncbi:MAG: beta-ketoacyl-ACP synthase 3, partial [Bacteroidales bacterium]|nr:beta-ketoacyl-ACP synthase 3 [Bacteroidales bacterium]
MSTIKASITGVEAFLPEYRLTNDELSQIVDTNDEWIMQRVGIKERRILKDKGKATSDMAAEAVKKLLVRTNTRPEDIELVICATITPDMVFPSTSNLVCSKAGMANAFGYDLAAACSGYLFGLETARVFIESGRYKKVILVAADKMSSITDYTDRTTCVLFGDAATATLIEPTLENVGIIDSILKSDGEGGKHLNLKAGGSLNPASHETVDKHWHYVYQEGQSVFKFAVTRMADVAVEIMQRNQLKAEEIKYL